GGAGGMTSSPTRSRARQEVGAGSSVVKRGVVERAVVERAVVDDVGVLAAKSSAARGPARKAVGVKGLPTLLKQVFGFDRFRPYQQAVCEAATAGEDLLLVMPTGAG